MYLQNTILEGFFLKTVGGLPKESINDKTSVKRGKIIACDLISDHAGSSQNSGSLTLQVGGLNVVERRNSYEYSPTAHPGYYKVIPLITGTIPKDRGNCLGFKITDDEKTINNNRGGLLVNFSINGVELIKNVSVTIFGAISTRFYNTIVMDIDPGSTFELIMINKTGDGLVVRTGVEFFFNKDETRDS